MVSFEYKNKVSVRIDVGLKFKFDVGAESRNHQNPHEESDNGQIYQSSSMVAG